MDIEEFKKNTTPRAKRSKLQPFRNDILDLRENGYSYSQITEYLANKGINISVVRLGRFIKEQMHASVQPEVKKQNKVATAGEKPESDIADGITDYPAHDPRAITQILGSPVDLDDLAKYAPKRNKP
jgi:hypothetical protein